NIGFGVGGAGGGGGDSGAVVSISSGNIVTAGDKAYGALIQSVGGGGGDGRFNFTGLVSLSKSSGGSFGIGIGGFGGDGGKAGSVKGSLSGNVATSGAEALGVVAQSVGGGGGNGGFNITAPINYSTQTSVSGGFGLGGFGGGGGDAANVNFARIGDTVTTGALSDAVTIQSVGGGGGRGR